MKPVIRMRLTTRMHHKGELPSSIYEEMKKEYYEGKWKETKEGVVDGK